MRKRSRGFSLTRALRNLSPAKWFAVVRKPQEEDSYPEPSLPISIKEIDRSGFEKLDHIEDDGRAISFVGGEPLNTPAVEAGVNIPVPKMATLKLLFGSPLTVYSKLRRSYGHLLETARMSSLSVSELFAGNQMLMIVSATPIAGRKKIGAVPSKGFVEPDATVQRISTTAMRNTEMER